MPKITFTNKVDSRVVNVPAINKIVSADINQLKDGVNLNEIDIATNITNIATNETDIATNVTDIATNVTAIGQTVKITGNQSIAGIKTFTDNIIATTQANATNDTTVATTAYVKNLIGEIPSGLSFESTWNADTDTPDLSTATPNNGQFWIVSVNGATNLSGITDWKVGDWAIYVVDGAGANGWQKVDNSSVLDGQGTGQKVALWSGSGDSNTLTNAPITVSGDDVTFAGDIDAVEGDFTGLVTMRDRLDLKDALNNTFIGEIAGILNSTGGNNLGVGRVSLGSNTTGSFNTALGTLSLWGNTSGGYNTALGYQAGRYITNGTTSNSTGSNSVFIGSDTKANADGETNQIVIGNTAIGNGSNTVTLGNDSITDTYLKGVVNINGTLKKDVGDLLISANEADSSIKFFTDNGFGTTVCNLEINGLTGAVSLKHYGTEKLFTTASGARVTGDLTVTDDLTITGKLTTNATSGLIHLLNTTNSSGGYLRLDDSGVSKLWIGSIEAITGGSATSYGMYAAGGNDLKFYSSAGLALTLDTSQNATFASSVTATALNIAKGSEGQYMSVGGDNANNGRSLRFTSSASSSGSTGALHTIKANSTAGEIKFDNGNGNILYLKADRSATFASSVSATDGLFSGKIGINANIGSYGLEVNNGGSDGLKVQSGNSVNDFSLLVSDNSDTSLFSIKGDGTATFASSVTATAFNTSSDYRLKEDLKEFNGLEMVSNIPVYDYKWKADESRSFGVMAHELQEVLPYAVNGEKDAEEMQAVDYSKIVPLLIKSIQELTAKVEMLESKK